MPNPLRNHIAKLAAEARRLETVMPPPPPPPPPPISKPKVEQWRHPMTDAWNRQFHEFGKRSGALPPPEEGYTRLYRAGQIPGASGPRKAEEVINGPLGPMTRGELDAMKGKGHSNPLAAEGRWFTDAANELDYYIRENDTDPVYYLDLPTTQAMQHRVDNTPFKVNSRNPEREFVLPLEQVQQARRLLDGLREPPR